MYNKIYFNHGTMFSGKTLKLISTAKTYMYNNRNILILKPSEDTRDINIKSRMSSIELEAITITKEIGKDLYNYIKNNYCDKHIDIILIDEVQFFSVEAIEQLNDLSRIAPIMCCGLKTSYTGELFPSIAKLLTIAEDIQEVKTTCRYCEKKATHNLLLRNGQPLYNGNMVNIEGEHDIDEYVQTCRYHFYNPFDR